MRVAVDAVIAFVPRRATAAQASAGAAPQHAPAWPLAAPGTRGRAFRIRHAALPPFEWELHLSGAIADLVLSLPRGLPWAANETRIAEPLATPEEATRAPVWDEGAYRTIDMDEARATLTLEGARIRGKYALEKLGKRLQLRRLDAASIRPFPDRVLPMLAHASGYPEREDEYAFEPKWDGIRALAYLDRGRLRLRSRNTNDITAQYPELRALAEAYVDRQMVLDGEIVAPDENGRPDFGRLQNRLGVVRRGEAAARSETYPVVYIIFDILYVDGEDVTARPYEERRELLEGLALSGPAWRTSPMRLGEGKEILAMPQWEGVVAKRLGSSYEPGARSRAWIKIKRQRRQELVIGGWRAGRGSRKGRIGALLVGYYDIDPEAPDAPRFVHAGSVGTGFTQATLKDLEELLRPTKRATSPFDGPVDKKDVTFVAPQYVVEVEFTEWTSDGKLRHPSYKGLREDKDPQDVIREER